jgi:antitoxin (DNA-binding transcriptional repressor) of toxin-antitoxin stability system
VGRIIDVAAELDEFVDATVAGHEVILARDGHPTVRLVPHESQSQRRPRTARHWRIPDELFLEPANAGEVVAVGEGTDAVGKSRS